MAIYSEEMRGETSPLRHPRFKRFFDGNSSNRARETWCIYCLSPDLPSTIISTDRLQGSYAKISEGENVYFLLRPQQKKRLATT